MSVRGPVRGMETNVSKPKSSRKIQEPARRFDPRGVFPPINFFVWISTSLNFMVTTGSFIVSQVPNAPDQSLHKDCIKMRVSPSNFTHVKLECRSIDECLGTCEVYSQLKVMTEQEALPAYVCADYLAYADAMDGFLAEASSDNSEPIDPECRVRMVEWCFQVIDFAKLGRETVSLAMSLLDRYLSTACADAREVILSRQKYQLASMTVLFLAIKMSEKTLVNASVFAELSRGSYTAADILSMESSVLKALKWRVNGPTTHSFLRYYAKLSSEVEDVSLVTKYSLTDLCVFQLDLSVGDYFFCLKKPSSIAIAALMNAVQTSPEISREESEQFTKTMQQICEVDLNSPEIQSIMSRLRMLLNNNGIEIKLQNKQTCSLQRRMSPVCITGLTNVVSDASMSDHSDF